MAKAADAQATTSSSSSASVQPEYKRCKEAIDAGLEAFRGKDYQGAIQLFNLALELPGNSESVTVAYLLFEVHDSAQARQQHQATVLACQAMVCSTKMLKWQGVDAIIKQPTIA
eukprot:GHRR01031191.1.p2 GENE.GHRR01031191.1~~GHRR01031191.1.p2  ORF type:complete len:123 (+),score=51.55 GHRR01031191.1:30-371(+)